MSAARNKSNKLHAEVSQPQVMAPKTKCESKLLEIALQDLMTEIKLMSSNPKLPETRKKELDSYISNLKRVKSLFLDHIQTEGLTERELEQILKEIDYFIKNEPGLKPQALIIKKILTYSGSEDDAKALASMFLQRAKRYESSHNEFFISYLNGAYEEYLKVTEDMPEKHYCFGIVKHLGTCVKQDTKAAIAEFKKARETVSEADMYLLEIYATGKFADTKAFELTFVHLKKSKAVDYYYDVLGKHELHLYHTKTENKEAHLNKAKQFFEVGSKSGHSQCTYELAKLLIEEGKIDDALAICDRDPTYPAIAFLVYKLIRDSKVHGVNILSQCYKHLMIAVENRYTPAVYEYGVLTYRQGQVKEGVAAIQSAALCGHIEAMEWMGKHLLKHSTMEKDIAQAFKFLELAAYQGSPDAALTLAYFLVYKLKNAPTTNTATANDFIEIAIINARAKLAVAQSNEAKANIHYLLGKLFILQKKNSDATMHLSMADSLGHPKARAKMNSRMIEAPKVIFSKQLFFAPSSQNSTLTRQSDQQFFDEQYLDPLLYLERASIAFFEEKYTDVLGLLTVFDKHPFDILAQIRANILRYDAYKKLEKMDSDSDYEEKKEATREKIIALCWKGIFKTREEGIYKSRANIELHEQCHAFRSLYSKPSDYEEPTYEDKPRVAVNRNKPSMPTQHSSTAVNQTTNKAKRRAKPKKEKAANETIKKVTIKDVNNNNNSEKNISGKEEVNIEQANKPPVRKTGLIYSEPTISPEREAVINQIADDFSRLVKTDRKRVAEQMISLKDKTEKYLLTIRLLTSAINIENFKNLLESNFLLLLMPKIAAYFRSTMVDASKIYILILENLLRNGNEFIQNGGKPNISIIYAGFCWAALRERSKGFTDNNPKLYDALIEDILKELNDSIELPSHVRINVEKILRFTLSQLKLYKSPFIFTECTSVLTSADVFLRVLSKSYKEFNQEQNQSNLSSLVQVYDYYYNDTSAIHYEDNWLEIVRECQYLCNFEPLVIRCQGRTDVTPLTILVSLKEVALVDLLLTQYPKLVNINQAGKYGRTVLHTATSAGDIALVKVLMKHGASTIIEDDEHQLPMHFAYSSLITILIDSPEYQGLAAGKKLEYAAKAAENGNESLAIMIITNIDLNLVDNASLQTLGIQMLKHVVRHNLCKLADLLLDNKQIFMLGDHYLVSQKEANRLGHTKLVEVFDRYLPQQDDSNRFSNR